MSITSMTNVAYVRRADVATNLIPANSAPKSARQIASGTADTPDSQSAVTTALKVIVTYIPTEILALYIAVLAAIQDPNRHSSRSLWIAFFCFFIATPMVVWLVYAAKVRAADKPLPIKLRTWPMWEMFAATVAYAAWAFGLPESPFKDFTNWYTPAVAGLAVLVVSTLLGLIAPVVQRPLSGK
jgi:hypothetical protein